MCSAKDQVSRCPVVFKVYLIISYSLGNFHDDLVDSSQFQAYKQIVATLCPGIWIHKKEITQDKMRQAGVMHRGMDAYVDPVIWGMV